MEPTFKEGDSVDLEPPIDLQRYDIVAVRVTNEHLIKRIVGVPGDTLNITNNSVLFNNRSYWVSEKTRKQFAFYNTLPNNSYFLVGDNINGSFDSRTFGLVSIEQIIGRVQT